MSNNIVGLFGRKHSGKSTCAKLLVDCGYTLLNFADALKQVVANTLDVSLQVLEEIKDIDFDEPIILNSDAIKEMSKETGIPIEFFKELENVELKSPRHLLQILGTDIIRQYNPNWHINKIKEKILNNIDKNYCIGDCRFLNEKKMIEDLNGECWFIIRPNYTKYSNHESEINVLHSDFDTSNIIINNGTLEDLTVEFLSRTKLSKFSRRTFMDFSIENARIISRMSRGRYFTDSFNKYYIYTDSLENIVEFNKVYPLKIFSVFENQKKGIAINDAYIKENLKLWNIIPDKDTWNNPPSIVANNKKLMKAWEEA